MPNPQTSGARRFGQAWVGFALALALHVTDEATHDFLSVYNPMATAIRARLPFLPLPTFSFGIWLGGLIAGILLLLALSPPAFRGKRWLRVVAWPLGIIVGVLNALGHIGGSLIFHRWMPGVYSAPVILAAGVWLMWTARRTGESPSQTVRYPGRRRDPAPPRAARTTPESGRR